MAATRRRRQIQLTDGQVLPTCQVEHYLGTASHFRIHWLRDGTVQIVTRQVTHRAEHMGEAHERVDQVLQLLMFSLRLRLGLTNDWQQAR